MKEYGEDEGIQNEEEFTSETEVPSEFESDFTDGGSDYSGMDENYGLGDNDFESDFSGLDKNYGLGNDDFETNLWEQDEDDTSDDGYWEPEQSADTDDWSDYSQTDDDWAGGEGDGGGWGTDGGDFGDTSLETESVE